MTCTQETVWLYSDITSATSWSVFDSSAAQFSTFKNCIFISSKVWTWRERSISWTCWCDSDSSSFHTTLLVLTESRQKWPCGLGMTHTHRQTSSVYVRNRLITSRFESRFMWDISILARHTWITLTARISADSKVFSKKRKHMKLFTEHCYKYYLFRCYISISVLINMLI